MTARGPSRPVLWRRRIGVAAATTMAVYAGGSFLRADPVDSPVSAPVPPAATRSPAPAPRASGVPRAPATTTPRPEPLPRPTAQTRAKPLGAPGHSTRATPYAAVTALLKGRAAAVLKRDRTAFAGSLDPAATKFRAQQLAVFANLAPVPLAGWSYVVDDGPPGDEVTATIKARHRADEVYAPPVGLRYQLKGFDAHPTELTIRATFVRRGDRWFFASDSDFDKPGHASARELWDFGPVDVVQTSRSLVLGPRGRRAYLQSVARDTDAAVPRVTAVWGKAWPQRIVVLVPTSQRQVSDLLGTRTVLSQIAAVAVSQVAGTGGVYRAVGSRVIINPPNFDQLTTLGRRVVLAHEVTHVASRDATGPDAPAWLVEGFADYVGYRGTAVDIRTAARELRIDVKAKRGPRALPGEVDFDGDNTRLAQSYEVSWLACRMIAERFGEPKLVAFYRAVGSAKAGGRDAAVQRALASVLAMNPAEFNDAWRAYVAETLE